MLSFSVPPEADFFKRKRNVTLIFILFFHLSSSPHPKATTKVIAINIRDYYSVIIQNTIKMMSSTLAKNSKLYYTTTTHDQSKKFAENISIIFQQIFNRTKQKITTPIPFFVISKYILRIPPIKIHTTLLTIIFFS